MKHIVLICVILLGYGVSPLKASSVITLADGSEFAGKLTLASTTIRVETSSTPKEIDLSDILEADFAETPFQLNFFYGSDGGNQLPATWKQQDIGAVTLPGSVVVADGTFTLNGSGATPIPKSHEVSDKLFFVGQPWTGNGQWTARVKEFDAKIPETMAGLMLRDTLDADSATASLGVATQGYSQFFFRAEAGKSPHGMTFRGITFHGDPRFWLRLTRYGESIFAACSSDGKEWQMVGQSKLKNLTGSWIGLFADSRKDKELAKVVIDQVSFTPAPSSAQVFPPGVLLQSGSFLAGSFENMSSDPASPDAPGNFRRNGKIVAVPRSKVAAVIMLPTARSQIADMGSHIGLLMRNGDVMDGDIDSINGGRVVVSSVLLGLTTYNESENQAEVFACFLHPLQAQPATYEIRLKDGSIVNAKDFSASDTGIAIEEVSGVTVNVSLDEIAQFRAGTSLVQSLAELNWKATPAAPPANAPGLIANWPSTNAAPAANAAPATNAAPAANAAPATNAAPAANAAPVANAVPGQLPPVQCWEGKNQEQIIEAPIGTSLEFPLAGKFRAMGVRIALSPDSPPNSNAIIRVLADGREIAHTPPFKAGDQPRFMEVTLQHPKTVTLVADSIFAGPKVLFIDPVALRDK